MKRSNYVLIGILIVLIAAAFLVLQQPGEVSTTDTGGEHLVTYDSAAIDRIDITANTGSVTLQKEGSAWTITSPIRGAADEQAVLAALGKGKGIVLKGVVSANPQKQSLFQVDSSGTLVRVSEKGTERAAFRIGKAGSTYTETYVRREGSDEVFLADGMLSYIFARQIRDWRDKSIFKAPMETITAVRFLYGDTTFTLALQDSVWRVDGTAPATDHVVRSFLSSLTNLQCDNFVEPAPATLPPLVGSLDIGGTLIRFHRDPGAPSYTVVTSGRVQVYEVFSWKADQLLKRRADFVAAGI